jgi:hypothetical protein
MMSELETIETDVKTELAALKARLVTLETAAKAEVTTVWTWLKTNVVGLVGHAVSWSGIAWLLIKKLV